MRSRCGGLAYGHGGWKVIRVDIFIVSVRAYELHIIMT
jgi:hypothetical protein